MLLVPFNLSYESFVVWNFKAIACRVLLGGTQPVIPPNLCSVNEHNSLGSPGKPSVDIPIHRPSINVFWVVHILWFWSYYPPIYSAISKWVWPAQAKEPWLCQLTKPGQKTVEMITYIGRPFVLIAFVRNSNEEFNKLACIHNDWLANVPEGNFVDNFYRILTAWRIIRL